MAADASTGAEGRTTPIHLWIVGALALLWNFGGIFDYTATKLGLDFYLSQFPPELLAWVDAMPAWATAAWALGVWGAFVGTVGLLLRRKWAMWSYGVSLFGLFVSSVYSYGLSNGTEIMGGEGVIMNIVIWIIAIFLLVYAWMMVGRGVLR